MSDHEYRQHWFNDYTEVAFQGGTVLIDKKGMVEFTVPGGYYGDDVEACVTFEELERVFAMASAMRDYHAQEARDEHV